MLRVVTDEQRSRRPIYRQFCRVPILLYTYPNTQTCANIQERTPCTKALTNFHVGKFKFQKGFWIPRQASAQPAKPLQERLHWPLKAKKNLEQAQVAEQMLSEMCIHKMTTNTDSFKNSAARGASERLRARLALGQKGLR